MRLFGCMLFMFLSMVAISQGDTEIENAIPKIKKLLASKELHFEDIKKSEYRDQFGFIWNWSGISLSSIDQPFIFTAKPYAEVFHRSSLFVNKDNTAMLDRMKQWGAELTASLPEFSATPADVSSANPHQLFYSAGDDPTIIALEGRKEGASWWLYLRVGPARLEDLTEIAASKGVKLEYDPMRFSSYLEKPFLPFQQAEAGKYAIKDGMEEMTWPNGDRFVGECYRKKPSVGIYYFANGDRFDGVVHLYPPIDRQGSTGKYIWKDGTTYAGGFSRGLAHGERAYLYKRNGVWIGPFSNGQLTGFALQLTRGQADTVMGIFKSGKKDGFYERSTATAKRIVEYRKDILVKNNVPQAAPGKFYCDSGNCINGKGIGVLTDGRRYEGSFIDGYPSGAGTMSAINGWSYTGAFGGGLPNGTGRETDEKGNWYEGEWQHGKRNGMGTSWVDNGSWTIKYTGQWVNNQKQGNGEEITANYSMKGEFRNGALYNGTTERKGYITDTINGTENPDTKRKVKKP